MRGAAVGLLGIAGLVLVTAVARADAENALGLGPRAAALGGAAGAMPVGIASLHHGPAALSLGGEAPGFAELEIGLLWAGPALWVEGIDAAEAPALALEPGATTAVLLGTRFDLGSGIGVEGLHGALALYSPVDHIFLYGTHPDDAPQWLSWGDRTQHLSVWAGLGWRVTPWLSVGAAARLLFDIELFTTGRVRSVATVRDPATGEEEIVADTELGEELRVVGRASPVASVLVMPTPGVRAGLTWRGETMVEDWGWARVSGETGGLTNLGYVYHFVHYYRPHELALSVAVDLGEALSIGGELTWAMWSGAVSGERRELPGRFGDVLVPAVGARWTVAPGVDVMAGYRHQPAFFDNQGGPTNLLENDQHAPSLGFALRLDELLGDPGYPFTVAGSVRLVVLSTETERKDWRRFETDEAWTSNPGHPGYRYGGVVPSGQLSLGATW